MSFGIGIGDIILLSQLSYQLYQSVTSGRKDATRDLAELADVLFGLRCALDHLHRVVENVSNTASSSCLHGLQEGEIYSKLDRMVKNCAATLEDLVSATKMYREGTQQQSTEEEGASSSQFGLTRIAKLKRRLAANVMKIRWDMDKETLKGYREKLQTHTDAINLILNTFLWSSSVAIHMDHQAHSQQLATIYDNVVSSNVKLEQLVQSIHNAVAQDTTQNLSGSTVLFAQVDSPPTTGLVEGHKKTRHDIRAHLAAAAPTPPVSRTGRSAQERLPRPNLPPSILSLNIRRREKAMTLATNRDRTKLIAKRPACFDITKATTNELTQGLSYIFNANGEAPPDLSQDVSAWTHLLNTLVESRIASCPSMHVNQQVDVLELLVYLNDKIDEANDDLCRLFYRTSSAAHFDDILEKLVASTRSVRVEKVVEEFVDVRQEWIDSQ